VTLLMSVLEKRTAIWESRLPHSSSVMRQHVQLMRANYRGPTLPKKFAR
jgi:hypothetical protein